MFHAMSPMGVWQRILKRIKRIGRARKAIQRDRRVLAAKVAARNDMVAWVSDGEAANETNGEQGEYTTEGMAQA
jgi:hypothetical protein